MRTRWARGKGATLLQARPLSGGRKANRCPECNANPNTPCVRWKEADGIRFVVNVRKTLHASR